MNWKTHSDKWKNSVLQLKVTEAKYSPSRPYSDPNDRQVSGTGFIIDMKRGFVATNAHVVENCITINGRLPKLGKRDLTLELIGICREKDLALCKIIPEDVKLITRDISDDISILNMPFGDNMKLRETDEVMAIGYPLGHDNIKYTTGIVSGFQTKDDDDEYEQNNKGDVEDAINRSPTYIQITAPINPGNSGGPLLNSSGEVIGIIAAGYLFAQNIGYAIPSRTFLAIYCELIKATIVKIPTFGLKWNKTNQDFMKCKTGDPRTYGIYVRDVFPDTCADTLETGDIIKSLTYNDVFWNNNDSFKIEKQYNDRIENVCDGKTTEIACYFDRYGDASVGKRSETPNGAIFEKLVERKMSFSEIVDMMPIGCNFTLKICRNGEWYEVKGQYIYKDVGRIKYVYPKIQPIDYEIFSGICCSNLNKNHVKSFSRLNHYDHVDKNKYTPSVVICKVFPGTTAFKTQTLQQGHIIKKINNHDIKNLEDIRTILRQKPETIEILTNDKSLFIMNAKNSVIEDMKLMKEFNINNHNYLLYAPPTQ